MFAKKFFLKISVGILAILCITISAAVFCITGEKYKHALPGKLLQ